MDKYEYKLRSEEIQRLIDEEKYPEAVEIADTIDWRRVRSATTLQKIAALYRVNRRNEDSRDLLLLAFERFPTNRSILYSLCEVSIELDDVVNAIEYYKQFVKMAPRDNGVYILRYKILEAQEASLEERIELLEELKKRDYQEEWGYELAYLYHRVGLETKCVEECDDIMLWFGDGPIVMKAMELKMLHTPLTKVQQMKYDEMKRNQEFAAQSVPVQDESYEDGYYPDEQYAGEDQVSYADEQYAGEDQVPYADDQYTAENQMQYADEQYAGEDQVPYADEQYAGEDQVPYADEQYAGEDQVPYADEQYAAEEPYEEQSYQQPQPDYDMSQYNTINLQKVVADSLKELLDQDEDLYNTEPELNANVKHINDPEPEEEETSSEKMMEDAEELPAEPIMDDMTGYVDTEAVQTNLQKKASYEQGAEPRHITGEMYVEEVVNEWEKMKQAAAQKRKADVEKLVKQQTGEMFVHFENAAKSGLLAGLEVPVSAAAAVETVVTVATVANAVPNTNHVVTKTEVLFEEQIEEAASEEASIEEDFVEEIPVEEAAVSDETEDKIEEVEELEEISEDNVDITIEDDVKDELEQIAEEAMDEAEPVEEMSDEELGDMDEAEAMDQLEEVHETEDLSELQQIDGIMEKASEDEAAYADGEYPEDETAYADGEYSEDEAAYADGEYPEDEAAYADEEYSEDEAAYADEEYSEDEAAYADGEYPEDEAMYADEEYSEDETVYADEEYPEEEAAEADSEQASVTMDTAEISSIGDKIIETTKKETKQVKKQELREFSEEQEELFGSFAQTKKVKKQILNVIDKISLASYTGNVMITGEPGLGTVDLAKNIVKEVQQTDNNFSGKVAKISGSKLNLKDLNQVFEKINNGALIIVKANGVTEECLYNMSKILDQENRGIIVIMEDTKHNMMKLLKKQAMIADYFNLRIDLEEMNNDALVAYAKNYALEQEYAIDEFGILALYTRISDVQAGNHVVTVDEVKDIVDEAIWNSKRFKISNFVDVLFSKRYDAEDMIVLRERDFI